MTDGSRPAVEERLGAFFQRLERLDVLAFQQTSLALEMGSAARERDRAEAERLVRTAGLEELLTDARRDARDHVLRMYGEGLYRPTMVGLNWGLSEGTTGDRVAAVEAVEDAVTATVVEPLADDELVARLMSPYELVERAAGIDASFDLTRATASALAPVWAGRWTSWRVVALAAAVVIALATIGAPVGAILVIAVAGAVMHAWNRRRSGGIQG